jgi:molecular chaperone DnaJ
VIRGRDVQKEITVSFKESALGCSKDIDFARNENCETCEGTGAKPKAVQNKCRVCNGTGHLVEQMNNVSIVKMKCEDCEGMGITVTACLSCSGLGSVRSKVTETVSIPAGVYSSLILRSQGKGNQMRKGTGQPGDLLLKVTVEDHEVFKRDEENVLSEAFIPFTKAVFGGIVQVDILTGRRDVNL